MSSATALQAHLLGRQPCEPVLQSMEEEAVGRNALTLHLLIQNHVQCGNLEAALDLLLAKDDTGASPASSAPPSLASSASITYTSISPPTFQYHGAGRSAASLTGSGTLASVVRLAATQGETALAADLIQAFEDQGRRLPEDVFSLLISASIAENDVRHTPLPYRHTRSCRSNCCASLTRSRLRPRSLVSDVSRT